ncbi:MAG: hypothetical protein G01um101456_610 [Parcubacteria group bacterium Gr01-1014_56]|nr:MAG: hypothetical protein G01um101456_610 [Parcubacteria group bacterium Gr01-1014_56]
MYYYLAILFSMTRNFIPFGRFGTAKFLFIATTILVAVVFVLALSPQNASAAALTVVTATTTSSNASTTLAKIGDTVQFGLQLSGTPVATSTPVINIGSMGTTSMTGSGAWWSYSTTTSASWSQGATQFKIGFGDSAPGINNATTTVTQTSLTGPNVTFDSVAPTLTIVSIASNNSSTTLAKVGDTITVTATSSENIRIPTITIVSQSATFSLITGSTTWKGTYAIVAGDTEGTASFSITYTDSAGNSGSDSPKTAVTTGSNVIVDTTAPSITTLGANSPNVNQFASYSDAGATASDSREGTLTSSITTTNPVNTSVSGTYTVTYTVSDSAGNAATQATRSVIVVSVGGAILVSCNPGYTLSGPVCIPNVSSPIIVTPTPTTPSAAFAVFLKNLSLGMSSEDVRSLQTLLASDKDIYPEGTISGYYGPLTQKAVGQFQLKYGVVTSAGTTGYGNVGPKTRAKLQEVFSGAAPALTPTTSPAATPTSALFSVNLIFGMQSSDVSRLQQLLATDSEIYPEAIVSGYFGQKTKEAVQRFQLKYKVVSSSSGAGYGVVGPKTRAALQEAF